MFKYISTLLTVLCLSLSTFATAHNHSLNESDISKAQLTKMLKEKQDFLLLDVRSNEEFQQMHIPTAVNIAYDKVSQNLNKLTPYKNKKIVVYCRSGRRAGVAINILKSNGFTNVLHLDGDMQGWQATSIPHSVH